MLIALGVTGGIGAYKAVEVARGLQKRGHDVVAIMTATATRFVGPVTFEAITRRRVITDQFEPGANSDIEHIALASTIDLLLIAPATANIIGKFANGIADDFLSTLYIATKAPVLVAPAMNTQMFEHEAVRRNLDTLAARGVRFVEPGEGYLACGWIGKGRLAEPDEIVAAAESMLQPVGPLKGQRILVTAGPTYEDVDPGPLHREPIVGPHGVRHRGRGGAPWSRGDARRGADVGRAAERARDRPRAKRRRDARGGDVARRSHARRRHGGGRGRLHARAARVAEGREAATTSLTLVLKKTPDILGDLGHRRLTTGDGPLLVGFAAETENLVARATAKRERKHADLIVANDVSAS